jgi:hypothetical protein
MPEQPGSPGSASTAPRPPDLRHLIQVPKFLGQRPSEVHRLSGASLGGEPVDHELSEGWTLLVFLSTSCDGCRELWDVFGHPDGTPVPRDVTTVVVTRSAQLESVDTMAGLSGSASVVMSDQAWTDYGVHAGPFFVLVDGGADRVATEGVAWSVEQITGAVAAARGDG